MKLRKQIKNRVVAVVMLAVFMLGSLYISIPVEKTHAMKRENRPFLNTTFDFGYEHNDLDYSLIQYLNVSGQVVSFYCTDVGNNNKYIFQRWIISDSPINGTVNERRYYEKVGESMDDGKYSQLSKSYPIKDNYTFTYNGKTYYLFCGGSHYTLSPQPYYTWFGNLGKLYFFNISASEFDKYDGLNYIKDYISDNLDTSVCTMVSDGSSDNVTTDETTWKGSQNNPIKKDDFGYPQIYNSTYIHNDPNNLETLDKLYSGQDFQWKKKTTTGFDLTNNDYNYTYIECKVKANYQYNDKYSGKGSWHDFASYGEMGNLGKVRAESLSHYYTFQEFQEALPKTSNELPDHKMRAIKSSAVYYFRVVCMKTSSTVVIPDEKDCKYYAGPWRSVTVTKVNGKDGTSVVEDGEFDENGEWKKDDDSGDNGKDIDNGSADGDDLSDASDKAHETINSNANKSTLDLDSAKAFINQVADVPKMIADIFSFLPDWVKYSFAFGFALIPILIIYKLIRG